MGISTKVSKQAYREFTVEYDGPEVHGGHGRIRLGRDGKVAVVYAPGDPPVIVTVLQQTQVRYSRDLSA
jgi:hypothetical protein